MASLQESLGKLQPAVAAITASNPRDVPGGWFSNDNMSKTGPVLHDSANETIHRQEDTRSSITGSIYESAENADVASIRTDTQSSLFGGFARWIPESSEARRQKAQQLKEQAKHARRESVQEAVSFIQRFLMDNWETSCENGHIKITCDITMDEVRRIGRLEQNEGWRESLKLVKAPVIHDEIGMRLWQELAKQAAEQDVLEAEAEMAVIKKPRVEIVRSAGALVVGKKEKRKRGSSVPLEDLDDGRRLVARRSTAPSLIESASADFSMSEISEQERSNSDVSASRVRSNQTIVTNCCCGQGCQTPGSHVDEQGDPKRVSISREISRRISLRLGDMASAYGGTRYGA